MRVAAVVVKQRTIPRNYHERYRWGESEYVSGRTCGGVGLHSHHSKHTKKNRERSKNRVEFNSVAPGRRALAGVRSLQGKTRSALRP
jgi:hypothetical protein